LPPTLNCVPASPLPSTVQLSRRERKKQNTRDALRDAALTLVEAHGLSGVTIEDITEAADVAPRTFFNYFSSKEDAVIGRDPGRVDELTAALRTRPTDEVPFDSIRQVLVDSYVAGASRPDRLLRRIQVIKSEPALLSRLAAQFEQLEHGLIAAMAERMGVDSASDLEPSLLVLSALATCRAALMHWCDQGGEGPLADTLHDAFERAGAGLAATAGPGSSEIPAPSSDSVRSRKATS
jgi:AcrR family transcriptional regulator